MSEIVKTEAIVLTKINYGDTSNIASLFTEDFGKISVIIKGGRNRKSKSGSIVDPLNYIQIIIYKKETRDVQLLSGADLIAHFSKLKEDLDSLKYAYAIIELVKKLTPDNEPNKRLFKGVIRILSLLDSFEEKPEILFGRFVLFLLKETGYEVVLEKCSVCGKKELTGKTLGYNFERGILCEDCKNEHLINLEIDSELFNYLFCLKYNKQIKIIDNHLIKKFNSLIENYLRYHVSDFKEIQSLKSF